MILFSSPARCVVLTLLAVLCVAPALGQDQSVVHTSHNLSASGPGAVRATSEQQICIFCHTPHAREAVQPMWNRRLPATPYTVYNSSSLDATTGQPTGGSKMCLSCHDGTVAVGSIVSRDQIISMAGGITSLPPGSANLGTDLSDDHPISFRYDSTLVSRDSGLMDPLSISPHTKLDANQELQCTTCHDAHDNSYGAFLVMDNSTSGLCISCHTLMSSTVTGHSDCRTCHQTHSAPSGPFLLKREAVTPTCLSCHDGSKTGAANIQADLDKISAHDTGSVIDPPERVPNESTCTDCHEPHSMTQGGMGRAPALAGNMGAVRGTSASGATLANASYEFEVCFRCHGDQNALTSPWVSRQITEINTRLEFDPGAVSYHPVETTGVNLDVPSLRPGWTVTSLISCSDCHSSDTSRKVGGSGPNGVHGSNHPPLLNARYETIDFTPESASTYALCYRCHDRDGFNGILADRTFPHSVHVVDNNTPCSVCHDAHGISSVQGSTTRNSHLINFDLSIVFPDQVTGQRFFEDTGIFSGSCTLSCHGTTHQGTRYDR